MAKMTSLLKLQGQESEPGFGASAVNLMSGLASFTKILGFDVYANMPFWENMWYGNDEYSTACNTISTLEAACSYRWQPEDKGSTQGEDWEQWKVDVDFNSQMVQSLSTKYALGNSLAVVAKGDKKLKQPDWVIQHIHPYQAWPVFSETGWIEYWKIYADMYKTGNEIARVHATDMMHFTNSMFAKNKLGLALGQQVYTRLKRKREIEMVCSLISKNMAVPMKHITVDITGYSKKKPAGGGDSEAQKKVAGAHNAFSRRVNIEKEFIWDVVTTDNKIEAKVIKAEVDLSSVVEFLKHDQELVDSALLVPPVFKARPDNSNRATSFNELLAFSVYIQQHWMRDVLVLQKKLLPKVLNDPQPKGRFVFDPIIKEDEIKKLEAATKAFMAGLLEREPALEYANIGVDTSKQT